jgi:hypothetical protein
MNRDLSVDVYAFDPAIKDVVDVVSTKFDVFCKARGISPDKLSEEYYTLDSCGHPLGAGHKVYWATPETSDYAIVNYYFDTGLEKYLVGTGCIVMRYTAVGQRECVLMFHAGNTPQRRAKSQIEFHPFRQYSKYHTSHITLKWDTDPKTWKRATNNINKLLDPILRALWQVDLFTDIQMASPIREQLFQENRGNKSTGGIEHRTTMQVEQLDMGYDGDKKLRDYALGIVDNPLDAMDKAQIDRVRADRELIRDMNDWMNNYARKLYVETTKHGTYVWRLYDPYCRSNPRKNLRQRARNFAYQVKDFFRNLGKANDQQEINMFVTEHCNPLAVSDPVACKFESKEELGKHRPDWFQKMCALDVISDGTHPTIFVEGIGGCFVPDEHGNQLYVLDLGESG